MGDNFLPRHEAIGVVFTILDAGQTRLPSRRIEGERIPAVVAPGFARSIGPFKNEVILRQVRQVVADGQSGLACSHDDRIHCCDR